MRRSLFVVTALVVLVIVPVASATACTQPCREETARSTSTVDREADVMLGLINLERANHGLRPLSSRADIVTYAAAHSAAMAEAGAIWHNDDYFTRTTKDRFGASMVGENVAVNSSTVDAHARLMNSPGHRANILEPNFTHVGIAIARAADGPMYFTQDFLKSTAPVAAVLPESAPAPEPDPESSPEPLQGGGVVDDPTVGRGDAPTPVEATQPLPRPRQPTPVPGGPTPSAQAPDPSPVVTVPGPDAVLSRADAEELASAPVEHAPALPGATGDVPPALEVLGALLVLTGLAGLAVTARLVLATGAPRAS